MYMIVCYTQHAYAVDLALNPPATCAPQVQARFVERFTMGAPFSGGEVQGPAIQDMSEKVSWVEKFVRVGAAATQAARHEHDRRVCVRPHQPARSAAASSAVTPGGHTCHRAGC